MYTYTQSIFLLAQRTFILPTAAYDVLLYMHVHTLTQSHTLSPIGATQHVHYQAKKNDSKKERQKEKLTDRKQDKERKK